MKRQKGSPGISLVYSSTAALKGRQSVRATFRLPASTINTVSIIAAHLGIKQKSLFDHLMDDMNALETIASQINIKKPLQQNRVQKTFVISRKSLNCLDEVAREYQTPRDMLIEYSVERLLPLIQQEQIKHRNRKKILLDIAHHMEAGRKLLDKTRMLLGEDDQVYEDLASAVAVGNHSFLKIDDFIKKGEVIEQFETGI